MEILVPIIFISAVNALIAFGLWLAHRRRSQALEVIREAIHTHGETITPAHIEAIAREPRGAQRDRDLRLGILLLAIAGASLVLAAVAQEPAVIAIAAFPALLGSCFVTFFILDRRRTK